MYVNSSYCPLFNNHTQSDDHEARGNHVKSCISKARAFNAWKSRTIGGESEGD